MGSVCLLGTLKLVKLSNQIGHYCPRFLFHIDFQLLLTTTTKNPASQR